MFQKTCFLHYCKLSSVFLVFKNVRERLEAKNYHPVCLLSVAHKMSGKLVNNKSVDHLDCRSYCSKAVLLTVVTDRIAKIFVMRGVIGADLLDL